MRRYHMIQICVTHFCVVSRSIAALAVLGKKGEGMLSSWLYLGSCRSCSGNAVFDNRPFPREVADCREGCDGNQYPFENFRAFSESQFVDNGVHPPYVDDEATHGDQAVFQDRVLCGCSGQFQVSRRQYGCRIGAPYYLLLRMHCIYEHTASEMAAYMLGMAGKAFDMVTLVLTARDALKPQGN